MAGIEVGFLKNMKNKQVSQGSVYFFKEGVEGISLYISLYLCGNAKLFT